MIATATALESNLPAGNGMHLADMTATMYRDLRRIASRHLSAERRNHTLQPTALVNEAYLKLARERYSCFADDVHMLAVLSRAMRQVLVDYARSRATQKRQWQPNDLFGCATVQTGEDGRSELVDILALDDALSSLAAEDERTARLIEMRYFGGMTAEECAEEQGISVHIVRHELRFGHAWLQRRMRS